MSTQQDPSPSSSMWSLAVDRPVATLMITVGIAIFGYLSFGQLPLALMPALSYPTLTVRTTYPGSAPEEIEEEVTRRLEETLRTVEGVRAVSSTSRAGLSDIALEFQWNTDMDFASQRVRERVDVLPLPEGSDRPLLLRYDPTLDPVIRMSVHGDLPQTRLRILAEETAQELEKLEGVAVVKVRGGQERIVRIDLDETRVAQLQIPIEEIQNRLSSENVNLAGGQLKDGGVRYLVRTLNEFQNLEELKTMSVAIRDDEPVRLGSISEVYFDHKEREVITHYEGRESVEIEVYKEADANVVEVATRVRERALGSPEQIQFVEELQKDAEAPPPTEADPPEAKTPEEKEQERTLKASMTNYLAYQLPPEIKLSLLSDQSTFIQAAIDEVISTALLGGLCAILILYIFLRSPSNTLIIGTAIPLSVICTFAPMRVMGISLNIMSLGGMALGIGMLVDNSIVVLESIFRCRQEGDDPRSSAIRGSKEVGGAVIASTLTTIAVFFPISFVEGVAGQLFGDLALTVVFSLMASLVVALFVVPTLAARQLQGDQNQKTQSLKERLKDLGRRWLVWRSFLLSRDDLRSVKTSWQSRSMGKRALFVPFTTLFLIWSLARFLILFVLELIFAKLIYPILALLLGLGYAVVRYGIGGLFLLLFKPVLWAFEKGFDALSRLYPLILRGAMKQRALVLTAAIGLFGLGIWWFGQLGMELIPTLHQGEFKAEIRLPIGTALEDTEKEVRSIETLLEKISKVEHHSSVSGVEKSATSESDKGEHSATIHATLTESRDLKALEESTMQEVRELLAQRPGVQYELLRPTLFTLQTPIQVELRGHNLTQLRRASSQVATLMENNPNLTDIRANLRAGFPEARIRFNRDRLASYGLTVRDVAEVVRKKVQGTSPSELRQEEERLDIVLRSRRADVNQITDLRDLSIGTITNGPQPSLDLSANAQGTPITLGSVADITIEEGPSEIKRLEGQRAAIVEANLEGVDLQTASVRLGAALRTLKLPAGITATVGGQNEEVEQARTSLLFALVLAIFLVYLVMASQFESLLAPLVILFSIPLAAVGIAGTLWATGTPLSIVVFIGMIMLAGIVVNNAIVLIDYTIQLENRGLERREAIVEACSLRLRPVLITTLTTILGLLPMALGLGEGAEIRAPMALTVISGLLSSTLLTLLVIPVGYDLLGRFSRPSLLHAPQESAS